MNRIPQFGRLGYEELIANPRRSLYYTLVRTEVFFMLQKPNPFTKWQTNTYETSVEAIHAVIGMSHPGQSDSDFSILGSGDFCVNMALPLVKNVGAERHGPEFSGHVFRGLARYLDKRVHASDVPTEPSFFGKSMHDYELGEKPEVDMVLGRVPSRPDDFGRMIMATMENYAECESQVIPNFQAWQEVAKASYDELRNGLTVVSFSEN